MAIKTEGLIVVYHNENESGAVLLHHKKEPDFMKTIDRYMQQTNLKNFWFAQFDWRAFDKTQQHDICECVSSLCKVRSTANINDFLKGKLVQCVVEKKGKWTVTGMKFDKAQKNVSFSNLRIIRPLGRKWQNPPKSSPDSQSFKRKYRMSAKTPNNIRHPYRG
jgi:hypothetical protein